ncbi:MAG TPA: hypothetical protein VHW65_10720 [Gemmatimonadales bacterium]|jgi:hypothetical protein|nr:hypothetical protein [Gemmatimonadales bacterium]
MMAGYLFAFTAVVTLLIGALLQVMISYLTNARWFAVLRRCNWLIVSAVPATILMVLPLVLGSGALYPWTQRGVAHSPWLGTPWFILRTAVYIGTWLWCATRMRAAAIRQDTGDANTIVASTRSLRRLSASGAIAVGVTFTFAGFDWVMSRDPQWTSTIFGVYLFAGGYLAALALIALLALVMPRDSLLGQAISEQQLAALATLIFMAAMLWAYIAFSQFLIIWIGDIPRDASWLAARAHGVWRAIGFASLVLQFGLPFFLFLFRPLKQNRRVLAGVATAVLAGHLLDSYWIVGPAAPGTNLRTATEGIAALVVLSLVAGALAFQQRSLWLALPEGDPDLEAALAYRR